MASTRGAAVLLAVATVLVCTGGVQAFTWRPTPQEPIMYIAPKNYSMIAQSECPVECKNCCKDAFSQVAWVLGAMPKGECKYCEALRYRLGRFDFKKDSTSCDKCLMDDFVKVAKHYTCASDFGRCAKCCMDLALVYLARYMAGCPDEVWIQVQKLQMQDIGFSYDGSSSCIPPPSPSPGPGASIHYGGDHNRGKIHDESVGTPLGQTKNHDNDAAINLDDIGQGIGV